MTRGAPTIVQIAKIVGVAPSTVSRAFTDPGKLLPSTVQRIREVAQELGYVPNSHARALVSARSSFIGMIVSDIANPFFPPLIRAAQRCAEEHGLYLTVADTDSDLEREAKMLHRLRPQVGGLILASSRLPIKQLHSVAAALPLVLVNRDVPGITRVLVSTDDALEDAVGQFAARGHRHLAYLGGPESAWSNTQRLAQFTASSHRRGLAASYFSAPSGAYEEGVAAAAQIAESGASAVVAFDDVLAHGLMSGFQALERRVPEDLEVLGCDDTLATTTHPPLSSIALDLTRTARCAVELLHGLTSGSREHGTRYSADEEAPCVVIEGRLVLRGSTRR